MDKDIIIGFVMVIGLFVFMVHIFYNIDSAMDISEISRLINTNQTYVDELDCEKIKLSISALDIMISPSQQEAVDQAKIDLEKVGNEKGCWQ